MTTQQRLLHGAVALLPNLVVLAFRLSGPEDLDDSDQAKQAMYALDVRENGNWILPQERGTLPASKPPLYAWLAAVASLPWTAPSALACRVPSVLASIALVLLVLALAEERFGARAGLYAAWLLACTHTVVNLSVHVRPDVLLALLGTAALFALHRAELGRPRGTAPLLWLSCALGVLAKGPLGLLVPLGGALALCRSPLGRAELRRLVASRWALWLLLPLCWALLAYLVGGSQYVTETVLGETVDRAHAIGTRPGHQTAIPGQLIGHFLVKGLPISLLGLPALARIATREGRARDPWLLLPCAGFGVGLVLVSLSRGQRQDDLLPFLPAAAVAAGAVLSEASGNARRLWSAVLFAASAIALAAGSLALAGPLVASGLAPLGVGGAVVLVATGALLVGMVSLILRATAGPRTVHVLAGVATLLLLHGLYNGTLSPVARSAREPDVRAFAASVRALATPLDRLRIATGVRGSVFFFLGHNQGALSSDEIAAYDSWAHRGGRLLLVANAEQRSDLDALWPGRFRLLAQQDFSRIPGGLVLLEDSRAREGR